MKTRSYIQGKQTHKHNENSKLHPKANNESHTRVNVVSSRYVHGEWSSKSSRQIENVRKQLARETNHSHCLRSCQQYANIISPAVISLTKDINTRGELYWSHSSKDINEKKTCLQHTARPHWLAPTRRGRRRRCRCIGSRCSTHRRARSTLRTSPNTRCRTSSWPHTARQRRLVKWSKWSRQTVVRRWLQQRHATYVVGLIGRLSGIFIIIIIFKATWLQDHCGVGEHRKRRGKC